MKPVHGGYISKLHRRLPTAGSVGDWQCLGDERVSTGAVDISRHIGIPLGHFLGHHVRYPSWGCGLVPIERHLETKLTGALFLAHQEYSYSTHLNDALYRMNMVCRTVR